MHHFNASAWPSKWSATEVRLLPPPFLLGLIVANSLTSIWVLVVTKTFLAGTKNSHPVGFLQ
jgi:hypothetical protein